MRGLKKVLIAIQLNLLLLFLASVVFSQEITNTPPASQFASGTPPVGHMLFAASGEPPAETKLKEQSRSKSQTVMLKKWQSGDRQNTMIEYFTALGCKACDKANAWMTTWKKSNLTHRSVFPISYHVDYWNEKNLKDPLAKAESTARQRQLVMKDKTQRISTPQFFLNGKEWFGFFKEEPLRPSEKQVGPLEVRLFKKETGGAGKDSTGTSADRYIIEASYLPKVAFSGDLVLQISLVVPSIKIKSMAGQSRESRFVAVDYKVVEFKRKGRKYLVSYELPKSTTATSYKDKLLYFHVMSTMESSPIQVTGGPIKFVSIQRDSET